MNAPTFVRTPAEEALVEQFDAFQRDQNDAMQAKRQTAFDAFQERGLPHRRIEDWKYTDLRSLVKSVPVSSQPAPAEAAAEAVAGAEKFRRIPRARIVFVNGFFVPSLSDFAGLEGSVEFMSISRLLETGSAQLDSSELADYWDSPILSLNSAFVSDGAVIRIAKDAKLEKPIEVVTLYCGNEPGLQTLRHQILVEEGAEVTFLQTYSGPDGVGYATNIVAELDIRDGAKVRWVKLQEEGDEAHHLGLILPRIGSDAIFDPFIFAAGSAVCRSELRMSFDGEDSKSSVRGATIAGKKQHIDTTLIVDHTVENCESREFFKTVLDDEARGVFQGKIIVRPEAQKTDGRMMSQALLLSEQSEFDNKPELEIFADDVQCAHGATCGQVDEEMLFFLRSRGIDREQAEQLLVQAFLAEVIEEIGDEEIEMSLEARTRKWLGIETELR